MVKSSPLKLGLIIVFLGIAVGVYMSHTAGHLYPHFVWSIGFVAGGLLVLILTSRLSTVFLVPIIGFSILHKIYIFKFPASLIGQDPDTHAVWAHQIVASGSSTAINSPVYGSLPGFHLLTAITSLLTGLPVIDAMVIHPIYIAILGPLATYVLTLKFRPDSIQAGLIASLLISIAAIFTWYAYWPIPQTFGTILWAVFLFLFIRFITSRTKNTLFLLFVVFSSLTFIHTLPLAMIMVVFTLFYIIKKIEIVSRNYLDSIYVKHQSDILLLLLLILVLTSVQWAVVTTYGGNIVFRILTFLEVSSEPVPVYADPTTAVRSLSGLSGTALFRGDMIAILAAAGISWLILLSQHKQILTQFLLALSAFFAILFIGGVVNPGALRYTRILLIAMPVFAPLIALGGTTLIDRIQNTPQYWSKTALTVVFVVFIFIIGSQIAVVHSSPDHPAEARAYLTAAEVAGKEHGHSYGQAPVYTDPFYALEEPFPNRVVDENGDINAERANHYETAAAEGYLNAKLTDLEYETILYRTEIEVYQFNRRWHLTWTPELKLDQEYNRIYTNNKVVLYNQ